MKHFMDDALEEARLAGQRGEVPVGAVIVHKNKIIARAGNQTLHDKDPTAHAETLVIREAAKILKSERLPECDLYVTLEPCSMCAAVISFARIRRLYFGAEDIKSGAVENGVRFYHQQSCHHAPEVYSGIAAESSGKLLKEFFKVRRIHK